MSTGGDRVRRSLGILGSLAWKPFGVAKADMPQKKWKVPRGALHGYGQIGQPKKRRGGRRERRRQCNENIARTEHVAKTGGGGWVAVAADVSESSSRNGGMAGAPRVYAAHVGADYRRTPQTGYDPPPGLVSEHYQRQYRQYYTQDPAWTYDDRGLQHAHTGRAETGRAHNGRVRAHAPPDQRSQAHVHHAQQHRTQQHHTQRHHAQQQQYVEVPNQYVARQPHVQHVSATKRFHVQHEVQHHHATASAIMRAAHVGVGWDGFSYHPPRR